MISRQTVVRRVRVAVLLVAGLTASACGTSQSASESESSTPARDEINARVADFGSGPHTCILAIAGTGADPPSAQCAGPAVAGLDWDTTGHLESDGAQSGTYHLVGTWDGTTLTLTEPPSAPVAGPDPDLWPLPDTNPPCPEPPGGWPSGAVTLEEWMDFQSRIQAPADYAGSWVKTQSNVADPTKDIMTIAYTGDPDAHRAEIEAFWPNPICVIQRPRTLTELRRIADEVLRSDGPAPSFIGGGVDEIGGVVRIDVIAATREAQATFDERYGPGVVDLRGLMQPVP